MRRFLLAFQRSGRSRESLLVFLILQVFVLSKLQAFLPLQQRHRYSNPFTPRKIFRSYLLRDQQEGSELASLEDYMATSFLPTNESSYFIAPQLLEHIKQTVDIVSVIDSYNLPGFAKKSEHSAVARCPFHDDHNPSMSIDNSRKLFKCFACGEGGDVFKFVRSYSALQGEPMTFYESVRYVSEQFGGESSGVLSKPSEPSVPRETEQERKAREAKRKRLLLCNAVAADFYGRLLSNLQTAGPARSHLRSRGLSPATVRRFALGYAPETYFQHETPWGEGSLTSHLKSMGFIAEEIEQAGLAKMTKRTNWKDKDGSGISSFDPFEGLMDRFRGRLIVPIFDESGKNVIGFGGRILASQEAVDTDSSFQAPKYINSPETPIFSKSSELFGLHVAKEAIQDMQDSLGTRGVSKTPSVVVVEGYMDAISLWGAGIRNAVSSMGTAISLQQLSKAAKAVSPWKGRIILCLDNDEAGTMAVERLCSNNFLSSICQEHMIGINVATLPDGIKDPGEYVERNQRAGETFQRKVLDSSIEWSRWYIDRLVSKYDSNALKGVPGSFTDVCEKVSDFLSTFSNPLDRTKRAYEVAVLLSKIISDSSGSQSASEALQLQLESDLFNMVARKAAAKESIERRVESVDSPISRASTVRRMLKGGVSETPTDVGAFQSKPTKPSINIATLKTSRSRQPSTETPTRRSLNRRQHPPRKPITPHFNGIDVDNPSDADWLGISQSKTNRKPSDLTLGSVNKKEFNKKQSVVYFNSNAYHGEQYLTQQAIAAGYTKSQMRKDATFLQKGIGVLIFENPEKRAIIAEERLLRNLVHFPPSRAALRSALSTSGATGTRPEIEWSSSERSWLFDVLILGETNLRPMNSDGGDEAKLLWMYLSSRDDAPPGAFGLSSPLGGRALLPTRFNRTSAAQDGQSVGSYAAPDLPEGLSWSYSDHHDPEDWALSHDPSFQEDFRTPAMQQEVVRFDDEDTWDVGVLDAEAAIDEKLEQMSKLVTPASDTYTQTRQRAGFGSLDRFFTYSDIFADAADDIFQVPYRSELEVQEALAYLLLASAGKKLSNVNSNWLLASRLLDARLGLAESDCDVMSGIKELDSMNVGDLQLYCNSLMTRLKQLYEAVKQLDDSAKRMSIRLLEYNRGGDDIEGRISAAKQREVCEMVDELLNELPDDYEPKALDHLRDPLELLSLFKTSSADDKSGSSVNRELSPEAEKYLLQKDLLEIENDWCEMGRNDYQWSMPEDFASARRQPNFHTSHSMEYDAELEYDEPIEETIKRIEEDWDGWEEDENNALTKSSCSLDDGMTIATNEEKNLHELQIKNHHSALGESEWE